MEQEREQERSGLQKVQRVLQRLQELHVVVNGLRHYVLGQQLVDYQLHYSALCSKPLAKAPFNLVQIFEERPSCL
jgi:hypothetical protein